MLVEIFPILLNLNIKVKVKFVSELDRKIDARDDVFSDLGSKLSNTSSSKLLHYPFRGGIDAVLMQIWWSWWG